MNELMIDAATENTVQVTSFVEEELDAMNCPAKTQMQIAIAINELFGNIAYNAYSPNTGPVTVCVEVAQKPTAVIITLTDNGVPYNPLEKAGPDTGFSAGKWEIGGLGIYMDEITYEYKNRQNILRIRKNIRHSTKEI